MPRILIVDDSALARKLLRKILTNTRFEIVGEADSGEKAIIEYRKCSPDIVTMDLDMPGIGGIEAAKRIVGSWPHAKIIFVSAHEQNDLKYELDKNGFKYYIIKPVTVKNVMEAMDRVILEDSSIKAQRETPKEAPKEAPKVSSVDDKQDGFPGIGGKVTVSHHSGLRHYKGVITSKDENILGLKILKETAHYGFSEDDPVIVGYALKNEMYICQGDVVLIDATSNSIFIKRINNFPINDSVFSESFPTSLFLEVRTGNDKRHPAIIKNMSINNMSIRSKSDFKEGQKISFDLYLEKKVIPLNGEIVTRTLGTNNFEYVLKVSFRDLNTKKMMAFYLEALKKEHETEIKSLSLDK